MLGALIRTAGVPPAQDHEAGQRPAVQKTKTRHWSGTPPALLGRLPPGIVASLLGLAMRGQKLEQHAAH
jgi:hypothetical protein